MKIKFLGNGLASLNPLSHVINASLNDTDFSKFMVFSAFTSVSGLELIVDDLIQFLERGSEACFYLGVDEGITSKSTLEEFLKLSCSTYIYFNSYQLNSPNKPIYHPKVYVFMGNKTRVLVGSNNLTKKGYMRNVEACVQVDFDNDDVDGNHFLDEALNFFRPLIEQMSSCIKPLDEDLIQNLLNNNVISNKRKYIEIDRVQEPSSFSNDLVFGSEKPPTPPRVLKKIVQRKKVTTTDYGVYDTSLVFDILSHQDIYGSYESFAESINKKRKVAYYFIPQGVHLGHIFYLIYSYYQGTLHNRINLMYESTGSGNGNLVRQTKYKLCFCMEMLLLSDDRIETINTVSDIELTPNGVLLARLLERNVTDSHFYDFKQGSDSLSWDMYYNVDYYVEWVKNLPEDDFKELYSIFNNFSLLRLLIDFISTQDNFSLKTVYTDFWDYTDTVDYLKIIGIKKPASESSLQHRMPFIISLLKAFKIIDLE